MKRRPPKIDDPPDVYIVALGALATGDLSHRDLPAPTFSVNRDHKLKWVEIPPSVTEDWE